MGPRMSMVNPMMSFTPASPAIPWQAHAQAQMQANPAAAAMMGQQAPYMQMQMQVPPNDPRFMAAHQHAMMVAKQAYQMAVAQQAMAQANDAAFLEDIQDGMNDITASGQFVQGSSNEPTVSSCLI